MTRPDAPRLYQDLVDELGPGARRNRFVDLLEAGDAPRDRLSRVAGEQHHILTSDRRSFALAASRFATPPAGPLFLDLSAGEGEALNLLLGFAAALGLHEDDLRRAETSGRAQAYPHHMAWLAMYGARSELLTAMLVNFGFWGTYCARTAHALRERYGFADDDVEFFTFFSALPPGFEETALAIIQSGLDDGEDPRVAARAARHMQTYEMSFWDSFLDPPG